MSSEPTARLTPGADLGAGQRLRLRPHGSPRDTGSVRCVAMDGERKVLSLGWADSVRSPIEVTVSCDQDAIVLTGTASAIASALQSR